MNPYYDATFFKWFFIFLTRLKENAVRLVCGDELSLYSDEIQLLTLLCFSCVASFLGAFLLLRRLTMMANALSHTTLLGIVLASLFSFSFLEEGLFVSHSLVLTFSVVVSLLTVWLIHLLSTSRYMTQDAANGMVFTFLFALGVTLLSLLCKNAQIGTEMLMGNIEMVTKGDLVSLAVVTFCVLCIGIFAFRGFVLSLFDPLFATCMHMRPRLFEILLLTLVGVTIASAFQAIGVLLSLAFFVIPSLTARLFTSRLVPFFVLSQACAFLVCFVGIALSRHILTCFSLSLSTQALIATLLSVQYVVGISVRKIHQYVT